MYRIYVRDYQLNRVGEITDFNKLELIPRFNNVGSFVLDLPTDSLVAKELIKPRSGIIVVRDGQTLMSGYVTSRRRSWSTEGDKLMISGKDDLWHLEKHLAYPVTDGPFTVRDYDIKTGLAETIMKRYVLENIGWRPDRAIALGMEEDKGLGNVITGRARFQTLLELMQSLAISGGGLGFRMVQANKTFEFQVYKPLDKTKSAFFSPLLGNLASFEYSSEAPETNRVIVGGGGEGKDRLLLERTDTPSALEFTIIESFVDRRDTTDLVELEQVLAEELATKAEKTSLSFTPIDTPSLSFGKDYGLGDKVSIVLTQPGEVVERETLNYFLSFYQTESIETERVRKIQEKLDVIQDVVREVKITITPEGETLSPVVGTTDSNNHAILGIFDKMRKISKRISFLERR